MNLFKYSFCDSAEYVLKLTEIITILIIYIFQNE